MSRDPMDDPAHDPDLDSAVAAFYARESLPPETLTRLRQQIAHRPTPARSALWGLGLAFAASALLTAGLRAVWPDPTPQPSEAPLALAEPPPPEPLVLPEGLVKASARIHDGASLVGFLNPGNYVDVLLTVRGEDGAPQTTTLLQSAFVIEIDAREPRVTFALTPEQQQILAQGEGQGEIVLTLRNDLDVALQPLAGIDLSELRHPLLVPKVPGTGLSDLPPPSPALAGLQQTALDPLSTFSIDVDTASYTLVRREIEEGRRPRKENVRVEEFVNYLPYDYDQPPNSASFGVDFAGVRSPFGGESYLVRVGIQGERVPVDQRKSVHLTFLVDTSGSMSSDDKLGLVKYALQRLTEELVDGDTVSIVAYAGSAGLVLPPTPMSRKSEILSALSQLSAGGSTAMGQGIALAYQQAEQSYQEGAVNRVVLLSDGDANVGVTSHEALVSMIRRYADAGITLTTAGFGTGNYKDILMEQLADKGDGNYYYIDSEKQAERVFVEKLTGTLVVIAKDVKIQVQWNPDAVKSYRLLGYDNRDIADQDFRNDTVDAGEIGSGHQVTAIYEIVLEKPPLFRLAEDTLAAIKIRSKPPGKDAPATERSYALPRSVLHETLPAADRDLRMAIASATFAELLRESPNLPGKSYAAAAAIARDARRPEHPEDDELISLIDRAARGDLRRKPTGKCRELQIISGGQKRVLLVDEQGVPCP